MNTVYLLIGVIIMMGLSYTISVSYFKKRIKKYVLLRQLDEDTLKTLQVENEQHVATIVRNAEVHGETIKRIEDEYARAENAHWKKYERLQTLYNNLFCTIPDCANLKYHRFRVCAIHLEGNMDELDNDPNKPSFQPAPTEEEIKASKKEEERIAAEQAKIVQYKINESNMAFKDEQKKKETE